MSRSDAGRRPLPPDFDPDSASDGEGGIYGLPTTVKDAGVVVVPVPFEATVSYGDGTANGPEAILAASRQVELYDEQTGRPYMHGITMLDVPPQVRAWSDRAREFVAATRDGDGNDDASDRSSAVGQVDELCERMNRWVRETVARHLDADQIAVVLGGDHSTSFGAVEAYAARYPDVGILHVDAHYDLREAYEDFTWSHASVMWNVLTRIPAVSGIVHVGIRDFGERERHLGERLRARSHRFTDLMIRDGLASGTRWRQIADEIVSKLPGDVYVSFDVDGLDPSLCPGTGTPVPGGLSFYEAASLLQAVVRSGRRIVGADLVEVAPQPGDREWNANVGARLLYKLIGFALLSRDAPGATV